MYKDIYQKAEFEKGSNEHITLGRRMKGRN